MAVLSIQSHVAYGHAGNSAAAFPLQRLGHEVWAVNTVEFSNHTGYKAWRGKLLGAALVDEIVLGLEERGVLSNCQAVLSGYLGDASVGRAILNAVRRVRAASPEAIYCCDPVMGDLGRGFYVSEDIPNIFKNEVVPMAGIVTPNQFELEALTGMEIQSLEDLFKAIGALHDMGPGVILVTSFREGQKTGAFDEKDRAPAAGKGKNNLIEMFVSEKEGKVYRIQTPELMFLGGAAIAGAGDLTASVFLSHYLEKNDVRAALERTAASVFGVMEATARAKSPELLLVAAQEELSRPSVSFRAEDLGKIRR